MTEQDEKLANKADSYEVKEPKVNKYNLTEEQIEAMASMTPKEKKVFLKPLRKNK